MTAAVQERGSAFRSKTKSLLRLIGVGLGATVLAIGAPIAAHAASPTVTGPQTGEWDVIAINAAPELVSFQHVGAGGNWGFVDSTASPAGYFDVGSGKQIDAHTGTAVTGGGIRLGDDLDYGTAYDLTVEIVSVSSGNVAVYDGPTSIFDTSLADDDETYAIPASGYTGFHDHYDWTFTGSGTVEVEVLVTSDVVGSPFENGVTQVYAFDLS